MSRTLHALLAMGALYAALPTSAQAQDAVDAPAISLEAQLERQVQIADNARQEVERLRAELALKEELIELAIERNSALYALASEVIEAGHYRNSREPFLQMKRVEMENLKQEFEDRARNARLYSTTLPPSVRQRMEEELN